MRNRKLTLLLAMLVLAIFAVGAVSAEDNVTDIDVPTEDAAIDEVVVDDDSAGETDEIETRSPITYHQYYINTSSDFDDINENIRNGTYTNYEFIFNSTGGSYNNFAMVTGNNNKFTGNGATIIGSTDNLFTVAGSNNIVITGFNMNVATGKAAIYGANVFNAEITNNNISGGKDGINIMQTYDNVTIDNNRITGVTRDAISLVDHRTLGGTNCSFKGVTIISNNVITGIANYGTEYGMFFGGNFKGNITGNVITGTVTGIEFAGKKLASNGKLCANLHNNNITDIGYGINMYHPNVIYLNITNCNIGINSENIDAAIATNGNFNCTGYIGVFNSNFSGSISADFVNATGNNKGNNTGFP